MIRAIQKGDLQEIAGKFGNVLELVTARRYPVIYQLRDVMKEYGAVNAMMSGSGPTVFGLFTSPKRAQAAYEYLRYGAGSLQARQVYLTSIYNTKRDKR